MKIWVKNSVKKRMRANKSVIRGEVLKLRGGLDDEERRKASFLLTERVLGHQWYYLSDIVLGFVPYGSEIDIREILQDALTKGKKLYLPKVEGDDMLFYRIDSLADLEEGFKGILEPKGDTECYVYEETEAEKTLMLMPGAAFDSMRNRIGYGKGFYDRYLQGKDALQLRTIAVGFQCQLVEKIPAEELDIRPYQVICV